MKKKDVVEAVLQAHGPANPPTLTDAARYVNMAPAHERAVRATCAVLVELSKHIDDEDPPRGRAGSAELSSRIDFLMSMRELPKTRTDPKVSRKRIREERDAYA